MTPRRLAAITLLVATCLTQAGCAGFSFLSYIFGSGEAIPAKYELKARDTLIFVDDPEHRLGPITMPMVVSNNIKFHLEGQREHDDDFLPNTRLVTMADLHGLVQERGLKLEDMPIDELGRIAETEQVIYVEVQSASLYHETRQVSKPKANVTVKVIDVVDRKRLFPAPPKVSDSRIVPPGHPVRVAMRFDGVDDSGGRGMEAVMWRELSEKIGKRVAELFYTSYKPPPGRTIK